MNSEKNCNCTSTIDGFPADACDCSCRSLQLHAAPSPILLQNDGLHRALRYGPHVDSMEVTVRSLLQRSGIDVNARDREGRTPLHLAACTRNCEKVVALLLERQELDVNATALFDLTPLHLAARLGYTHVVALLLQDTRLTLNAVTTDEFTAFHLVMEGRDQTSSASLRSSRGSVQDRCEVVKILLAEQKRRSSSGLQQPQPAGCEFARDVLQRTPLHYAAESGHGKMIQELANYSPNTFEVNAVDVHGFTPLHLAVLHDHRLVISLLLGMPGVDVNIKAPSMICNKTRRRLGAEVRMISGAPNVSERLFPVTKVEPPASRNAAMTPLHFAAKMGHQEALELLLISSCSTGLVSNINARDSRGCTALHFAVQGRHEKSVELLLQQPGILPNAEDNLRVTPLQHAVKNGHSCKVVELLLEKVLGSKEMRVHGSEKRKFELFAELLSLTTDDRIHKEIAEVLLRELKKLYAHNLSRSVDGTLVHEAARLGGDLHTQLIPLILRWRPGDANALDSLRQTPLHRAVFNAHIHAVKALFRAEKGWRLRATQPDKDGKTPLEYAVRLADKSSSSCICNLLLDRRDVMHQQKRLYDGFKNTANCTLVGGTLISGVAYMGWLQPPLGFNPDYNYPVQGPAVPPGTFENFADGSNPFAVKFFFFNGLAFFYAMGALFAVAGALIFMNNKQRDGRSMHFILERTTLNRISYGLYFLLYLSVLSMCLAFMAAGFAVLAPGQRPRLDQILFLSFFFYLSAAVLLVISYILFCKIWKIARNYYMQLHTSGNAHSRNTV
ncbi:unnamed protein product [Sphagnum balticum]